MAVDTQKFFADLKSTLARNPAKAMKIGGRYQINIAGAGSWGIDLSVPAPFVLDGQLVYPSVTINIADRDFQKLLTNRNEATKLFFSGKINVTGDQMLALKLEKLLALK